LGSVLSGGGQPDPKDAGDVHLANMGQQNLWNNLYGKVMSGSGDFGAGQGIKQGKSQLAQFMNDRGISPQSGAGIGAYANKDGLRYGPVALSVADGTDGWLQLVA